MSEEEATAGAGTPDGRREAPDRRCSHTEAQSECTRPEGRIPPQADASGEADDDGEVHQLPFRCHRPTNGVGLLMPDGTLRPMRCGASNRCAYCAWLAAVENCIVVGLDARASQPTVGITLTTHRADFDLGTFRLGVAAVFKRLRRRLGDVEYLGLMEWTTGRGGHGRMPHMHALVKGLDPKRAPAAEKLVRETWREVTGGAWVVEARELVTPGGAIAYMVGHHHKREQAPPPGLRGMKRMRPSRGYFDARHAEVLSTVRGERVTPIQALREQAKRALAEESAKRVAMAKLAGIEAEEDVRDRILEQLLEDAQDAPAPLPVRVLRDGRLASIRTGEVADGDGVDVFRALTTGRGAEAAHSARDREDAGSIPAAPM